MRINLSLIFILSILSFLTFCKDRNEGIQIYVTKENNPNLFKTVGINGTFGMITDTKDLAWLNITDLEKQTSFTGYFYNTIDGLEKLNCRLWDPEEMNVVVICQVRRYLDKKYNYTFLDGFIILENYKIYIESEKELSFKIEQKPSTIPFIYSGLQTINLYEKKESYKLKFKTDLYQEEKLAITEKQENISFKVQVSKLLNDIFSRFSVIASFSA